MAAPYDIQAVSTIAEAQAASLAGMDRYDASSWGHPTIGPVLRIYALLTHRPQDALGSDTSPERIAECRLYAYVFLTTVHAKMTGDEPARYSDGFMDLVTEYDQLAGVDVIAIHDAALDDALEYSDQVPSRIRTRRSPKPGSVRRSKRPEG